MYYYIVNPAAGGAKVAKIQEKLTERLRRLNIFGEFVKSTGPDDVAKLARLGINKGYKTIVAVGGDGTINEVLNEIIKHDGVALGVIPTGTTNDLAYNLGIRDWYSATGILASRKIEDIELGRVGDRFFVTSVAVGFDPKISHLRRLSKGNIPEKIKFSLGLFSHATAYKPIETRLTFDKSFEVTAEVFNVLISGEQFSPLKKPKSHKTDPMILDTVLITKIPGIKALKYGFLSSLNVIEWPKISVFHSKEIHIETKKATWVIADGQRVGKTPISVTKTNKKIKVIVARKRKF